MFSLSAWGEGTTKHKFFFYDGILVAFNCGPAEGFLIEDVLKLKVSALQTIHGHWIQPDPDAPSHLLGQVQGILSPRGGYLTHGNLIQGVDERGEAKVVFVEPALTTDVCHMHGLRFGETDIQPC